MNTICVYHSIDLDGWMSAAIARLALEDNTTNVSEIKGEYNTEKECGLGSKGPNSLYFFGYNYGDVIPDLTEFDKIIMCDISFPKEHMEVLFTKLQDNFIWCDHHISAIKDSETMFYHKAKGIRNTKFAACELTWLYFMVNNKTHFDDEDVKNIPEIIRLIGLYDSFRHKNTDEEQKVLEFQYGARECITDYRSAYDYLHNCLLQVEPNIIETSIWRNGKSIYQYLCTEAKQSYKNGFEITFDFTTLLREQCGNYEGFKFICINKERFNPINFGIDYHKEGYDGAMCFHIDNNKTVCISLYNDNGQVDCSAIAKSFGGGGHFSAAGARMNIDDFKKLISNG